MPLYKVTEKTSSKSHLVSATSQSAALRHVSQGLFDIRTMENPTEVAALMEKGTRLEYASKEENGPADPPSAAHEGQEQDS